MPENVKRALRKVAAKYAKRGKLRKRKGETMAEAKNHFIYGTMANMMKRGEIS